LDGAKLSIRNQAERQGKRLDDSQDSKHWNLHANHNAFTFSEIQGLLQVFPKRTRTTQFATNSVHSQTGDYQGMSALVEGIMNLIRHCEDLPHNMSRTEVTHYASVLASKLKSGENIEQLDYYLSHIMIGNPPTGRNRRELAERALKLFSSLKAARLTS